MRKVKVSIVLLFTLVFLFSFQLLYAQGPPRRDFPDEETRERIREEIETIKMWKMLEVLDLSGEQSDKFLPAWKEVRDAHKVFKDKREDLLRELEFTLREEQKGKEKKITEILDQLQADKSKLEKTQEKLERITKEVLSLEQQAKLLVFEEKFERRMMEMIRKYRGNRGIEK
ncbi:MAG: hypothetical protein OEV55_00925 [candidate division Zixibacteria bacterium]|nr:hypothetical protein [candidate division Zixibacteria bacterium]